MRLLSTGRRGFVATLFLLGLAHCGGDSSGDSAGAASPPWECGTFTSGSDTGTSCICQYSKTTGTPAKTCESSYCLARPSLRECVCALDKSAQDFWKSLENQQGYSRTDGCTAAPF